MLPKAIAVKKTVFALLKNKWPAAIAVGVIPLAFFLIAVNIFSFMGQIFSSKLAAVIMYIIFALVLIFIGLPLLFGALRIFWSISAENQLNVIEIFYYFSSLNIYKKFSVFIFYLLKKIVLKAFVLLLPSFIIDILTEYSRFIFPDSVVPLWFSNIWVFAVILRSIAICCIIYISARYYLAPFLFIATESENTAEYINKAYNISRHTVGNFMGLLFSLIGWIVLSVFFVPMVFTLPYFCMCYIMHSRYALVYYNSRIKNYERGV